MFQPLFWEQNSVRPYCRAQFLLNCVILKAKRIKVNFGKHYKSVCANDTSNLEYKLNFETELIYHIVYMYMYVCTINQPLLIIPSTP